VNPGEQKGKWGTEMGAGILSLMGNGLAAEQCTFQKFWNFLILKFHVFDIFCGDLAKLAFFAKDVLYVNTLYIHTYLQTDRLYFRCGR